MTKDTTLSARLSSTPVEAAFAEKERRMPVVGHMRSHERDGEPQRLLVTVEEAAKMLSIGRTVAYQLMQKGEISSVKIGRTRRVAVTSIGEYVRRLVDGVS